MRKLLLSLLLLLSFCSFSFAEDSSENLRRTDSQREADIESAIKNMGRNVSEIDAVNFRDALRKSRNNFIRLYRSQWKALGMSSKLDKAIDNAFSEKTAGMMWGTRGIRLGTNIGNAVDEIQEATAFNFADSYDDFLKNLEERWGESLQTDISDFLRRGSITILAAGQNPMMRAYIRQSATAQNRGDKVLSEISESMRNKYPNLKASGATFAGGLALIFRKQLTAYLAKYAGKTVIWNKVAKSAAGKLVGKTLPVVGQLMLAWSLYDVASIAWNAELDVNKMLHERNQAMYSREMPEVYWDIMEPYVMDVLTSSYGVLQETKRQAEQLADNPKISALSSGLNDTEAMEFAERISYAAALLGNDKFDYIVENFGERIRDSSRQNFQRLMQVIQQKNISQVKEWLDLAGTEYYDFYALFPQDIWEKYTPDSQSLEILRWLSKKLTPSARNTASKLSIEDIKWVIAELPERFVPQLFGKRAVDADSIHYEILRLSEISDPDSRQPWQSVWEYRWSKYGLYVIIAAGVVIFLWVAKIFIPLFTSRRISGGQQSSSPVIINVPPSVPQTQAVNKIQEVKNYDVKLRISRDFVDDARRTQWHYSQTLIPEDNGNGTYIFSVKLESLEQISVWIKRHRESIEVLSPEELKGIIN